MQISIVVPCFNEQEVLPETIARLTQLLSSLAATHGASGDSALYFVDDGSSDSTWAIIEAAAAQDPRVHGIKLSRNRGHQLALLAGLLTVPGDAVVSVDADLQDDLAAIPAMVSDFHAGTDIVFGVRRKRTVDTLFKRLSAEGYYRILKWLGVDVVFNHADYRLLSRRALEALGEYPEVNMFLRGIISQLGFRTSIVYYERQERFAGDSKYPLRKMLALAWNGVTSFSAAPLRAITSLGFVVSLASIGVTLWALAVRIFTDRAVPGWASTVVPIYFLGGVQLLSIGMVGEYVAKIYAESKRRPRYFIDRTI
jgi:polyisoprenyl-phosphate glycosyltransferase